MENINSKILCKTHGGIGYKPHACEVCLKLKEISTKMRHNKEDYKLLAAERQEIIKKYKLVEMINPKSP